MAKTNNLGLNVWGEHDNTGNWLEWRLATVGTGSNSNMMILDAWAKTVEDKIANVQSELTFDSTPTAGSDNPVTSDGIKAALDAKQDELFFDDTPQEGSNNPVTSGGVYDAIQSHVSNPDLTIKCTFSDTSSAEACQNSAVFEYSAAEVRATYNKLTAADAQSVVVSMFGEASRDSATAGHTLNVTDVTSADGELVVSFLLTPSLIEGLDHVFHAALTFTVGGSQIAARFHVEPIDGTTDIGLDDSPVEDSTNLVTSGGVWEALNARARSADLTAHTGNSAVHVTASNKSTWNAKQNSITASGILKGNGNGGVSAAVAGTDYCTPEDLEEGLQGKAPTFSPLVSIDLTSMSNGLLLMTKDHIGKTMMVTSKNNVGIGFPATQTDSSIPVGAEMEFVWCAGADPCIFVGSNTTLVGSWGSASMAAIENQYGVAVAKKLNDNTWLLSGDITL